MDIAVLLVFIKPNKLVDVVFKFDNWVVWPFIKPNNEFEVEFVEYIVKSGLFIIVLFQSDWNWMVYL